MFIPLESRPDVILKVQPQKLPGSPQLMSEQDKVVTDTFLAFPRAIR